VVTGSGDAVILIHGYSTRHNSWRTWQKNIERLATRFQVFALDLLGYGDSDKPKPALSVKEQAKSIMEFGAAEKVERAHLVGLSWGGGIAQAIASDAPERVMKLVLVDSTYDEGEHGRGQLARIKCPTLIVWDEEDAVIPVAGARFLGESIPNNHIRILKRTERDPGADPENRHWSQMTHSANWNRAVMEFLLGEPVQAHR
jgi:pimeloyl-ACP methyl ester carboxylesterase